MAKLNTYLTRSAVESLRRGRPWILSKQLKADFELPKTPAVIPLGEHWFWYSPKSEIRLRRMGPATRYWPESLEGKDKTYEPERNAVVDNESFKAEFLTALTKELVFLYQTKQKSLGGESALRWVFGDTDGFGGLVIDIFNEYAVVQIQSAPIEYFWEGIKTSMQQAWLEIQKAAGAANQKPLVIIEHRDGAVRTKEGLDVIEYVPRTTPLKLRWNGLNWHFNPAGNQKTGAYLDQKENHLRALAWAQRLGCKTAWDICSFEGGFALHLAHAGINVCAVDSSKDALQRGAENALLNQCEEMVESQKSDAFDFLRLKHKAHEKVDMIILDPPALAPTKRSIPAASKAYRELNLRAIHCLNPGGLLVTCSCSHVFTSDLFLDMLSQAEHHTRRKLRILQVTGPASDHTPSLQLPESDYLQAYFIQVL